MSVACLEQGPVDAPAIIFLHGAGVSRWMWQPQIEGLSGDYRCIAVDLPDSGDNRDERWQSLAKTAGSVADVVRCATKDGRAHIVGLSLGGYVGLTMLTHMPEVLDSLLVSGVTTRPFTNRGLYSLGAPLIARSMRWSWVINKQIAMMGLPEVFHDAYRQDARRTDVRMIVSMFREVLAYEFQSDEISAVAKPRVLAVAGEREPPQVQTSLEDIARLKSGRAARVPDAGHVWNVSHSNLFTRLIRAWVEDSPLPEELICARS